MKQVLEDFSKAITDYQTKLLKQEGHFNEQSYLEFDRLTFIEYDDLYDITWYTGNYGFQSTSKKHLENPKTDSFINDSYLDYYEYGLDWLIDILIENGNKIRSLTFLNPHNFGYNGCANWDFIRLVESNVVFPNLQILKVQLYEVGDHNQSFIGNLNEDGNKQVTQLLEKMPNLVEVEIPGTPDSDFFKINFSALRYMKVQAGFDSKHFIKNLSHSPLLGQISLDFMDCMLDDENPSTKISDEEKEHYKKIKVQETYVANSDNPKEARKEIERQRLKEAGYEDAEIEFEIDKPNREKSIALLKQFCENEEEIKEALEYYDEGGRWLENGEYDWENDFDANYEAFEESPTRDKRTALEDYKMLLQSKYIKESWHFKLREHYLTQEELKELHELNPKIQFLHIPTAEDYYLSHRFNAPKLK